MMHSPLKLTKVATTMRLETIMATPKMSMIVACVTASRVEPDC
jgi:hypothetical protein